MASSPSPGTHRRKNPSGQKGFIARDAAEIRHAGAGEAFDQLLGAETYGSVTKDFLHCHKKTYDCPHISDFGCFSKKVIKNAESMLGMTTPTAIQAHSIPHILNDQNVVVISRTGSGKSAAFLLPLIHKAMKRSNRKIGAPMALVFFPSVALAIQVSQLAAKLLTKVEDVNIHVMVGGQRRGEDRQAFKKPVDILFATLGRLYHNYVPEEKTFIDFSQLEYFVADEVDDFLRHDNRLQVSEIWEKINSQRDLLDRIHCSVFSATFSDTTKEFLESLFLPDNTPYVVICSQHKSTPDIRILTVAGQNHDGTSIVPWQYHQTKRNLLVALLRRDLALQEKDQSADFFPERTIVFVKTKKMSNFLAVYLESLGFRVAACNGNFNQEKRMEALSELSRGKLQAVIASTAVARGSDIEGIKHVIIYEFPSLGETFDHQIGRTARAGHQGRVTIFYTASEEQPILAVYLRERLRQWNLPNWEKICKDLPRLDNEYEGSQEEPSYGEYTDDWNVNG